MVTLLHFKWIIFAVSTYDVMIDENDFPRREIHGGQNGHVSAVLE